MSGPLLRERAVLDAARARRASAERDVLQRWKDVALDSSRRRVIEPLDRETERFARALDELDLQLARALAQLGA